MDSLQQAPQSRTEQLPQWMAGLGDGGLNNPMADLKGAVRNMISQRVVNEINKKKVKRNNDDARKRQLQQAYDNQNQQNPMSSMGQQSLSAGNNNPPMTKDQERALQKATGGSKLPEGGMGRQRPDVARTPKAREQQREKNTALQNLYQAAKLKASKYSRSARAQALRAIRSSGPEGRALAKTLKGNAVSDAEFAYVFKLAVLQDVLGILGEGILDLGLFLGTGIMLGIITAGSSIPIIGPFIGWLVGSTVGVSLGGITTIIFGWSGWGAIMVLRIAIFVYMWWYLHYRLTVYKVTSKYIFVRFFEWLLIIVGVVKTAPLMELIPFNSIAILFGWMFNKTFSSVASEEKQEREIQKVAQTAGAT